MANIRTADSALLIAQEKVMAWWPNFINQWQAGYGKVPVAMAIKRQPQPVKDELQRMAPQSFERVMRRYGGENGKD